MLIEIYCGVCVCACVCVCVITNLFIQELNVNNVLSLVEWF